MNVRGTISPLEALEFDPPPFHPSDALQSIGWNWPMSSALISTISWLAGTPCCRANRGRRCETFVTVGPQSWAVIFTSATGADIASRYLNSCRNRSCPKCQATARAKWLADREAELLPVPYFHVTFTLPQQIGRLALQKPKTDLYHPVSVLLRKLCSTIAADPRHPRRFLGFLAVLHTWGQNLHLHPHLHCVVPGGGFSPRWLPLDRLPQGFFLPSL